MCHCFKNSPLLPPNARGGQGWRERLRAYAHDSTDVLDGLSIQERVRLLTGMYSGEHAEDMGAVRGPENWGGFLELALSCQAWASAGGGAISVMMLHQLSDGRWESLSVVGGGGAPADAVVQICVAWQGGIGFARACAAITLCTHGA